MNISDDQFLLSDYIMYGVKEGQQTAFANREAINTVLPGVALKDYTKEGSARRDRIPGFGCIHTNNSRQLTILSMAAKEVSRYSTAEMK